jgi:hypothetical protein
MATRRSGRSSGARTTGRIVHLPARHGHRAAWIAGTGVVAAGVIAAVLLLKNKSANATPAIPAGPAGPTTPAGPAGPTTPAGPAGPTTTYTALQAAAVNANKAQDAAGYTAANVPYYKSLQSAAGLTADGWPGQKTYAAVKNALASVSPPVPMSSNWNAAYTFANPPGWNGVTAPDSTTWWGAGYTGSTDISGAATVPAGTNTTVISDPASGS